MKIRGAVAILVVVLVASACRSSRDYVAQADGLFADKKYPEAILIYRKAIQKDPRSAETYYKLGITQRANANYAAAYESFTRAVTLDPDLLPAQIELGNLYLGDYLIETNKNPRVYRKISEIADRLLAKDSHSFAGLRFRGYLSLSDRKPDEAISYFEQARAVDPAQLDVVLGLTQALLLAGRYPEARQTADELIAKHKTYGSVYDVLYAYEMSTGHAGDAESLLKLKMTNNPEDRDAVMQLAEHYWRTGKHAQTFQLLDAMLREDQIPWRLYAGAADFYERSREWDRAADALALGLKAHPEEQVAFSTARAQVLALQGKPKEAIGLLGDALQAHSGATELKKARALLLLDSTEAADKTAALRDLQSLALAAPQDTDLAFQLGRAYSLNGMPDKAASQFELVVRKEPTNVAALLALAELSSTSRKFQQSLRYAEWILSLQPGLRNARLLHATALVGLDRLDEAHLEYTRLVRDQPAYTEAKLQLAMLDVRLKRYQEAEKRFEELYDPKHGDFRAMEGLVQLYTAQGRQDKALARLNTELERFPNALGVRALLASTAEAAGKIDLAIQQYEQLLAKRPGDREIYTQLGALYQNKHDLSRSLAMLQKAVELVPDDWKGISRLAAVQQEAGQRQQAAANYRRAMALGADEPNILNNLAYIEAEGGSNLDDALALVQRALARSPDNFQYADTAGFIYLKRRDTASALHIFQSLCRRFPNDAGFRYHHALALLQSGNRTEAEHELRSALAADPSLADEAKVQSLLRGN